ncbi:hypothetical protein [Glaciihabitans sp. dw_435]|uniref:hypothetical protein n=1 Tax=Glaciihabitans sp. dw_435 TaxID=2720081 RepID=UPI001BD57CE9|nr:hypothetical protein [Glaciihabitans sp. dw_435]
MTGIQSNVTVTGDFGGVIAQILAGAVRGQNKAAERLLALSAAEVPLDVGTLESSGSVVPAGSIGDDSLVTYDTPYAARLHEDAAFVDSLGRRYPGGSNFQGGRKSHYLSDPALQNKDELLAIIAAEAGRG